MDETSRDKATELALMATRVSVTSSLIKSIGPYVEGALDVEFQSGHTYRYTGISVEHYYGLLKSDSPGAYFNRHIKGGCDSCTRLLVASTPVAADEHIEETEGETVH